MRNLSRWFKQTVIVVAVLGLLTSAWPSVAQGEKPPLEADSTRLHKRLEEMPRLAQPTQTARTILAASAPSTADYWSGDYIHQAEGQSLGGSLSAQFDRNGYLHAAYIGIEDRVLRYAHYTGSAWQIEILEGGVGDETSLVIDSHNRPHLLYASGSDLRYATTDGAAWSIQTVLSDTTQASLDLDSADQPHISYYAAATADLKYMHWATQGWQTESIDTVGDVGRGNRLKLDASGQPHVAYCVYDSSTAACVQLKYAVKNGATWQTQVVDAGSSIGSGISLALDGNSQPHISYAAPASGGSYSTQLRYAIRVGNVWQPQVVYVYNSTLAWTSIQIDRVGYPHIAVTGYTNGPGEIYYATRTTGAWQVETSNYFMGGSHPVQLIDHRNFPVIVYNIYWGVLYAIRVPNGSDIQRLTYGSYRDSNFEVYTAQSDGSNPARRTSNPAYDSMPRFNRGATRVAFISARDGNSEVYVMNADGSGQTRLTYTPANEYLPTWSPDGSKIACYSYRDGNSEVYVMNADGSGQTRLTYHAAWDGEPAWSPDGTQIVFASTRSGLNDLWLMNADGSNLHQLTFGLRAAYPAWSPDGSQVAFNDDTNNDGWLDLATININGSGLVHPAGYTLPNYDFAAPNWSVDGQTLVFARIQWVLYQGNYYWVDAYLQGVQLANHFVYGLNSSGLDWWPNWQTTDSGTPVSSINPLPAWTSQITFTVSWGGYDVGAAGISVFDIQYRDGVNGSWNNWLTQTPQASQVFTGTPGHTYYFRSRARDYANNLEAYPGGNGDTSTTVYQYSLTDQILGNRDQPVAAASITTGPSAINTGLSRHDGLFDLYFASGGIYTLTTTRNAFGVLPPLFNVSVPFSASLPTLYLPPLDDQLSDGHFESGTLSAWNPIGPLTPTITSTAHTGNYAALLGGTVPSDTVDIAPYLSTIEQTITIPLTLTDGTLSLLYKVTAADPLSDSLNVYLTGATGSLTFTLPITATDWTHQWFDVSTWAEPTATLHIELATPDKDRAIGVLIDEVTWGSSIIGSRPIYLPVIRR